MGLIMRRNLMAAKSGQTAKDYVQDGLIAMWDGIENAGFAADGYQHDPNATVWKDLSGTNNLSVVGNRFGSNYYQRYDTDGNFITPVSICDIRSLSFVITMENSGSTNPRFFGTNNTRARCEFDGSGSASIFRFYTNAYLYFNGFHGDGTYAITILIDGKNVSMNLNGRSNGSITTGSDVNQYSSGTKLNIGAWNGTGSALTGKILNFRIYSSLLSPEEIAANYAIDKARFNLT